MNILWHSPSLGLEWKLTFSSTVATAELSKFEGILSAALTASSFRIWNSSAGILSPPLAFFAVMLLECLSWLHTPRYLALGEWSHHHGYLGHWDLFLYSSVYSCHLFLISSASVRSMPFLSFILPIFAWNVHMVSLFFLKISLVFTILLFSSISLHWSWRKALSHLAIHWNSAFK